MPIPRVGAFVLAAMMAGTSTLADDLVATVEPSALTMRDVAVLRLVLSGPTNAGGATPSVTTDAFAVEPLPPLTGRRVVGGLEWRFLLAPIDVGVHAVAVSVPSRLGGIQTQVSVEVVGDASAPPPPSDRRWTPSSGVRDLTGRRFVVAEVEPQSASVHEQVTYRFAYYFENWLPSEGTPQYALPPFAGFRAHELDSVMTLAASEAVDGSDYHVQEVRVALFPLSAGRHTLDPAELVLPASPGARAPRLRTEAIDVEARPLPDPVPGDFSGGVGEFAVRVEPPGRELAAGESARLRVRLSGRGDLRTLTTPPNVSATGARVYEPTVTDVVDVVDGRLGGARTFEYVVSASSAGTYAVVVSPCVTFSPVLGDYRRTDARRFTLVVTEPREAADGAPTDRARSSARGWVMPASAFALVGLLAVLGVWVLMRRRRERGHSGGAGAAHSAEDKLPRSRMGLRETRKRLRDLSPGDGRQLSRALHVLLLDYLGDEDDGQERRLEKVHAVVDACVRGEYGPEDLSAEEQRDLIQRAMDAVAACEATRSAVEKADPT